MWPNYCPDKPRGGDESEGPHAPFHLPPPVMPRQATPLSPFAVEGHAADSSHVIVGSVLAAKNTSHLEQVLFRG